MLLFSHALKRFTFWLSMSMFILKSPPLTLWSLLMSFDLCDLWSDCRWLEFPTRPRVGWYAQETIQDSYQSTEQNIDWDLVRDGLHKGDNLVRLGITTCTTGSFSWDSSLLKSFRKSSNLVMNAFGSHLCLQTRPHWKDGGTEGEGRRQRCLRRPRPQTCLQHEKRR